MSWLDRLTGDIGLTSPEGLSFVAKWVGDARIVEKQLGIFSYPKVDRQIVQDLGIKTIQYPLTLFFDGPDNDLESTRFFNAMSARGDWIVDHPTKGRLFLQPVSFKEEIRPVESGSVTVINTSWIDVGSENSFVSAEQLSAAIEVQNANVENPSLDQLTANIDQSNVENIQAVRSTTEKSLTAFNETLGPLAEEDAEVSAQVDAIQRSITDTLESTPVDLTVLGGQIQALVSAPAAITGSVLQNLRSYESFIEKLIQIPVIAFTQTERNVVAILEIFGIAGSSAANLTAIRTLPDTRAGALSTLDSVSNIFITMTDAFDVYQEGFTDQLLEDQYFSQSQSFVESSLMTAQTASFLLSISFDLAIEKRFLLKEDRTPVEITITEYGALGDDDEFVDLFIGSNGLRGADILILPAGREVVVYV